MRSRKMTLFMAIASVIAVGLSLGPLLYQLGKSEFVTRVDAADAHAAMNSSIEKRLDAIDRKVDRLVELMLQQKRHKE